MTAQANGTIKSILRMNTITKRFPGVVALKSVDFDLKPGEIHALCGANGAGKSTLMKILAGVYKPDEGEIYLNDQIMELNNPKDASSKGIAIIHQEFSLFPNLEIVENIFYGKEYTTSLGLVDRKRMLKDASAFVERLGLKWDLTRRVSELTIAQQQLVEIAKALSYDARILIMDEPTAALSHNETNALFEIINDLRKQGLSIVYISHRLNEVVQLADRATVLRNGETVASLDRSEITVDKLSSAMAGKEIVNKVYTQRPSGDSVLEVRNLSKRGVLNDISFTLYRGEVLGLGGLVGAGRTELARCLFGVDRAEEGQMILHSKEYRPKSPSQAVESGIGFVPEDRRTQGLFLNLSVGRNISFSSLSSRFQRLGFIQERSEQGIINEYVRKLHIRAPGSNYPVANLSGGNQQKCVLARWLCRETDVLILDEPTRGVDVGAKKEIMDLIDELAKQGMGIIFISSELEEVVSICDRVLVMYEGRFMKELTGQDINQSNIMYYATGGE